MTEIKRGIDKLSSPLLKVTYAANNLILLVGLLRIYFIACMAQYGAA